MTTLPVMHVQTINVAKARESLEDSADVTLVPGTTLMSGRVAHPGMRVALVQAGALAVSASVEAGLHNRLDVRNLPGYASGASRAP